jgi:dUTP pyrophosphatase
MRRGPMAPDGRRETVHVAVVRLPDAGDLPLPSYMTDGASGMDLLAAVVEPVEIMPGGFALVPTGIAVAIPAGYEAQVRSRSGLALERGAFVLNAPGTIDSDYRGEIGVILANLGGAPLVVRRGERIAQLVFARVACAVLTEEECLASTAREDGGFGHTGGHPGSGG